MDNTILLQKNKLYPLLFIAGLVISGVLIADHSVDSGKGENALGGNLFIAGWLLFALFLAFPNGKFDLKNSWLKILGAILVLVAATTSQKSMKNKNANHMMFFGLFATAWIFFAWTLAYDLETKSLDSNVFQFTLLGSLAVIGSMFVLKNNRRYSVDNQDLSGPSNVYNPGIGLFTLGWVMVMAGISQA